ncbi:MAG: acyl-CoA synthetase (AMP-forming)/AMP-acid ligase, partial [Actinomycetia bacterium]|nr:acyl-CoA synthetase (AMP-forming)/AMP-acid ligase [Actinomycetes bacterium]
MTGRWDGTTLRWPDHPMLGPGSPYELVEEQVLGEPTLVFAERLRSYRELVAAAADHGDADAFVFGDRRITYAQHERLVASVAAGLAEQHGVGPGDRVALLGANSAEWVIAFGAIASLGAVVVALNGWWTPAEVLHALELTRPGLLLADRRRAERLAGTALPIPVVVLEDELPTLERHAPSALLPDTPIDEDAPAVILFTSGTTGRPKGAISSHRNLLMLATNTSYNQWRTAAEYPDHTVSFPACTLAQLPLFHVSGLHGSLVHCLALGQKSVWPLGRFDEPTVLRLTEEERITTWSVVATQLLRLLEHPDFDRYDLSSLAYVGGGGSAWPPELIRKVQAQLPQVVPAMSFGFGQTESSGMGTVNIGSTVTTHPSSVGAPRPTCEVQIRDTEGAVLPEGDEGEILLRGPFVFVGYDHNPEATAETIIEGRWLRTGDLGWVRDGLLYISTRRTDLIIRGGENVYPIEIENRLVEHPAVADAAVAGRPDAEWGQAVMAWVVLATPVPD